jgi:DNA-binding SARP family transcriptional activator
VFLSEAEWQTGEEAAADAAADVALDAAARQGSNHLLLQALSDFPEVVARRMDAETETTSPWHALARALIAQGHTAVFDVPTVIELREFGEITLTGGGVTRQPPLKKVYELLAWLAARQGQRGERSELLDVLFGGRGDESTRAYLRQLLFRARELLPELQIDARTVGLGDGAVIRSESVRFEAALAEAARLQGDARLRQTRDALLLYDAGPYLPGIRSAWSESRRDHLHALAQSARVESAELAFRHGRFKDAAELTATVLADDPLRESAWRLKMRLASAVGDDDAVLSAFRGAQAELAKLDLDVSAETRRLITQLRH